MRIFMNEMKKLWNWKLLIAIMGLGILTFFALMLDLLTTYKSYTTHGIYGKYQNEMYDLYGVSASSEELADYDIEGKLEAEYSRADEIIAQTPVFVQYGILNYAEFVIFMENLSYDFIDRKIVVFAPNGSVLEDGALDEMERYLNGYNGSINDWYDTPMGRIQSLRALDGVFSEYQLNLLNFIKADQRPVVVRVAKAMLEENAPSLVRYDLSGSVSDYAAIVGVFCVIATLALIAPTLTNDRARRIVSLQYSSRIGRKMIRYQFAATLVSTILISVFLIAAAWIPYMATGAIQYWNADLASFNPSNSGGILYHIPFGQYVLVLSAMIVACALASSCAAFALARYSANIITLMIKAVPVGAAVAAIAALSLVKALMKDNIIFATVFRWRLDMPEVMICAFVALIGILASIVILHRERRTDLVS